MLKFRFSGIIPYDLLSSTSNIFAPPVVLVTVTLTVLSIRLRKLSATARDVVFKDRQAAFIHCPLSANTLTASPGRTRGGLPYGLVIDGYVLRLADMRRLTK
jgi:hypothetical protein